jgi:hypothetical protein
VLCGGGFRGCAPSAPSALLRRGRAADPPHKGPSLGLEARLSVGFMFYRISMGRRHVSLFLVLFWSAAVGDNSQFGVFNSLLGRREFPACAARELARKGLICCTVFAGFVEKIDGIPGSTGKTGNLSPPGGTGRGQGAALLAGDTLPGAGPNAGARATCTYATGKLVHYCAMSVMESGSF